MADSEQVVDVTVSVGELVQGLKRVKEVIPRRSTLPITTHALFRAGRASPALTLQGTDLERYMTVALEGGAITGGESCAAVIPVHAAMTFLGALLREKGGDKKEVHIKGQGCMASMGVDDVGSVEWADLPESTDFPEEPKRVPKSAFRSCEAAPILTGLRAVLPAVAGEDTRPVLTCVAVSNKGFVTADGFRLHIFERPDLGLGLPEKCDEAPVLVPAATVQVVLKLFKGQEKIGCAFTTDTSNNKAWFEADGMTLASQMVQGTYPNWRHLVPKDAASKINFSSPVMVQRLDMLEQDTTIVRLEAAAKEGDRSSMRISVNQDGHRWNLTMPATVEATELVHIGFNRKYLRDAVRLFSVCTMAYVSPSAATLFTGDVEGLSTVVMPMFVQW